MTRKLHTVHINDVTGPEPHYLELELTAYAGPGGAPYLQLNACGPQGDLFARSSRQVVRWALQELLDAIDRDRTGS